MFKKNYKNEKYSKPFWSEFFYNDRTKSNFWNNDFIFILREDKIIVVQKVLDFVPSF
jgi:hypothetical protein